MSGVVIKMKMSPTQTGALYMKSLAQKERIAKLESEIVKATEIMAELVDGQSCDCFASEEAKEFIKRHSEEEKVNGSVRLP